VLPGETGSWPVVIQQELDLCRLCQGDAGEGIYINPVLRPRGAESAAHFRARRPTMKKLVAQPSTRWEQIEAGAPAPSS